MADVENATPDESQNQSPAMQTESPDMSAASTIPMEDQNAQLQQPGTPVPQNNPNAGAGGTFEHILQVLAGNPRQGAHYDPNTGQEVSQPVTSKTSLATHIVAAALTGMFRGMAAPPGPGHVAQAGNLALEGSIQDQDRRRAQMQQDYERQQQAQVQKYQVAHLNAQTALDTANAQHAGMESLDKAKQMNDEAIQQLAASGAVETDANGNPVAMTQADILAKIKSGELNAGDSIGMAYGGTLVNDKPSALYVVNKDPNAPVKISQDQYDRWTAMGVNVPKEVVGQSIPAKSYSAYSNQALVHATGEATLATLRHDAGDNKDLAGKLPASIDPNTPGIGTALRMYQQALRGTKGNVYQALETVYQHNPQAGNILMDSLGGKDLLSDINNQHEATVKADAGAEEAQAKADIENGKPVPGTAAGKPTYAIYSRPKKGWTDVKGNPIDNFSPAPSYAAVALDLTNAKLAAQTKSIVGPDGVAHDYAYDPKTQSYTRDMGVSGSGSQGSRLFAAGISKAAGEDLIADIQNNKDQLGSIEAWVKQKGLNVPYAGDPDAARLYAELVSFAALQPAQHGFRSTSALDTFEKLIGGLQKNPEATIASIRGINRTTGALLPKGTPGQGASGPATDTIFQNGHQYKVTQRDAKGNVVAAEPM